jgi:ABC-type oligopeptide transport system substrate-binding subunit
MRKKLYLVLALTIVGGLLASCQTAEPETIIITAPPEITEVEVEVPVTVEIIETEMMCTYNAYRMGWVMDYADANNMVNEVFHPDSPFQYTFWDDETFRGLVEDALVEGDAAARIAIWQQAENILMNDYVAVFPIFHYDRTGLVQSDVTYEFSPFGAPHYAQWALPAGRDTLRVRLATEPPTLDVNLATDTTSHAVLNQLMEAPYYYDGEGAIQPAGATGYEVSDDGTVYTVYLREDATWSDGEPVLAQHYVDGIIRLLDPATAAEYAYVMYYISGASAFNTGETDDPSTVGVVASDDYTLVFTLDSPQSFFDSILAFFTMYPVRLDVIEQYGDQWTEPGNFVGNGPFAHRVGSRGSPDHRGEPQLPHC